MVPPGIEDAYPLSRLQAGMLFHSGLADADSESAPYHNLSSSLEFDFDEPKLRDCLRVLAARHPVLRTSIDLTIYEHPSSWYIMALKFRCGWRICGTWIRIRKTSA